MANWFSQFLCAIPPTSVTHFHGDIFPSYKAIFSCYNQVCNISKIIFCFGSECFLPPPVLFNGLLFSPLFTTDSTCTPAQTLNALDKMYLLTLRLPYFDEPDFNFFFVVNFD